jgi:Tol biopolymer transport system component
MRPADWLPCALLLAACGDDSGGPSTQPDFPGEIAYLADGAIQMRDLDAGTTRRFDLGQDEEGVVSGALAWAPDGSAIVFAPFDGDRFLYELHRVALDGSGTAVLFPNEAHEAYPAFSPDGRLGYWVNGIVSGEDHGYEIFVDAEPYSPCGGYCQLSRPAWSPDGTAIIVVGGGNGVDQLIRIDLSSGTETSFLQANGDRNAEQLVNPEYSRSGDRVAFTRIVFGASETDEIWVVSAGGGNPTRLTSDHFDDKATWSPDDQWIAFERNQPPGPLIGVIAATGGEVSQLIQQGSAPAWR